MGQILSIIFGWLRGERNDKKKPSEKLPLIAPPRLGNLITSPPSLGSCRDYALQTNLRTHPPPPLSSSSNSSSTKLIHLLQNKWCITSSDNTTDSSSTQLELMWLLYRDCVIPCPAKTRNSPATEF
ncbi:unnamed protein product, partial [Vitis vinifera]